MKYWRITDSNLSRTQPPVNRPGRPSSGAYSASMKSGHPLRRRVTGRPNVRTQKSTGKNVRSRVVKRKSKEAAPRTAISGTRDGTTGPAPAAASATAVSAPERRSRTKARLHAAMKNCIAASAALNSAEMRRGLSPIRTAMSSPVRNAPAAARRVCSVCGARDVTEQIGAFADRYPHHYENGECIYCRAHEEGPTDPGPTLEPEPGTNSRRSSGTEPRRNAGIYGGMNMREKSGRDIGAD